MNAARVLVSWSGGKDSVLTLAALRAGGMTVAGLLTTITEDDATVVSHGVPVGLLVRQAEAVGLPLRAVAMPRAPSNARYRSTLGAALEEAAAEDGVTDVAFGDLHLEDVRAFREEHMAQAGLRPRFPLWGTTSAGLAAAAFDAGLDATVVRVDRSQVPRALAGRPYAPELLEDLPPGADPAGEGGEFHTFVHRGPGFAWRVDAAVVGWVDDGRFTTAVLAGPDP